MRPLDAYHGNHHTFWPRLYSALGRHSRRGLVASMSLLDAPMPFEAPAKSSGLSDSVDAKATDCRPEVPSTSPIGVGSDGRALPRDLAERGPDAGVEFAHSPRSIPASIFEVASPEGREAAKERARL